MATRGVLKYPEYHYDQFYDNGSVMYKDLTVLYQHGECLGYRETLNPLASGSFRPNVFRINPVVIEKVTGTGDQSYISVKYKTTSKFRSICYGNLACVGTTPSTRPVPAWPTSEVNTCVLRALSKLQQADADLALMLAELGETLEMLRNPLKGLVKYLSNLRRGKLGSTPTFLSDAWLLYRYGITPFISDIESIMQLINGKLRSMSGLVRRKSGLSWVTQGKWPDDGKPGANFGVRFNYREDYKIKHSLMAHAYGELILDAAPMFDPGRFGFDPRQLPALAWELVPYSFVVDWFFSIGDWLRAITPNVRTTYKGTCVSYKTTVESNSTIQYTGIYDPNTYLDTFNVGKYAWIAQRLERRVISTPPVLPAFTFNNLSIQRILDSLALLWQQLPKR